MARITVERAHSLGKEEARAKADKLAQKLQAQYGLEPSWSGDTLNLKRSGVKGTVQVADPSGKTEMRKMISYEQIDQNSAAIGAQLDRFIGFDGKTAFVALGPSLASQLLYMRAVELIGPNRAGLFSNLTPIFGALFAVLILGEEFHVYHALALAFALTGIWLAEQRAR